MADPATAAEAAAPPPSPCWVYVLACGDGTMYCGWTTDVDRRLAAHRAGRGAAYTRGRGPLELLAAWPMADRSAALRAEAAFKRLPAARKRALLATGRAPALPEG